MFVILTYRSTNDLEECILSIEDKFLSYKILIVNSFYDVKSKDKIQKLALKYKCDFINVENKGYGYGNNRGIEYCLENYEFDYLVISNPDIIIRKNCIDLEKYKNKEVVIAPSIITKTGKNQNPYWVVKNNFAEKLVYIGYKYKKKSILFIGLLINKIIRIVFNIYVKMSRKLEFKIYASHGCFVIFSFSAIKKIGEVYDENMFLFAEEALLAHRLEELSIPIIYTKEISICHKEDGSISVSNINEQGEVRKSVIYYFEKIKKR